MMAPVPDSMSDPQTHSPDTKDIVFLCSLERSLDSEMPTLALVEDGKGHTADWVSFDMGCEAWDLPAAAFSALWWRYARKAEQHLRDPGSVDR